MRLSDMLFAFFIGSCICQTTLISCQKKTHNPNLPPEYQSGGTFIKSLPYHNPDSCVLLIRQYVPAHWQGAAYENLFLDGPEVSPIELGFKHLDWYEKNFPADSAHEFAQLFRGLLYDRVNKLDSAVRCLEEAHQSAVRNGRMLRANDAQVFLAGVYYTQGNTAQAIRAQLKAYNAIADLDSTQNARKFVSLSNIGNAYSQSGNNREALHWAKKALELAEKDKNTAFSGGKGGAFHRVAIIYQRLGLLDSALLVGQIALDFSRQNPSQGNQIEAFLCMGSIFLEKGDCMTALRYLQEARQKTTSEDFSPVKDILLIATGKAYKCLGQLDSAEIFLKAAMPNAQSTDLNEINRNLSEVYAQKGDFKAAYAAADYCLNHRRKFFSPEKIQEMGAIKSELELQLAEQKNLQLQHTQQLANQRSLILALSLLTVLGIGFSLFSRQRSRSRLLEKEKQLLENKSEMLAQDKELAEALALLHAQAFEQSQALLKNTQSELNNVSNLLQLKNQLIEKLELDQNTAPMRASVGKTANLAISLRQMKILTNSDWQQFRESFEKLLPGLLAELKTQFPELTASEIRLFMLQKLQFDITEISETLGISPGSVWRGRHRLTKKLGLPSTVELDRFIVGFN